MRFIILHDWPLLQLVKVVKLTVTVLSKHVLVGQLLEPPNDLFDCFNASGIVLDQVVEGRSFVVDELNLQLNLARHSISMLRHIVS